MAPIPMKAVLCVTSEDEMNPASNLLSPVSGGKWLCAEGNRSRMAEVVVELAKKARITSLEIRNFGSAFVEVLVSDSGSPEEQYITLLHMTMLMSVQESRTNRNGNKVIVCGRDKLSTPALSRKWNRVKIRCVQKYNQETQFGLRTIAFFTDSHDKRLEENVTSPSSFLQPVPSSQSISKTQSSQNDHQYKYPSLPSSESLDARTCKMGTLTPARNGVTSSKSLTPKQTLKDQNKNGEARDDFEFSGVEKQSRLFRDCIYSKPDDPNSGTTSKRSNQILERIAAEKNKYKVSSTPLYSRKNLLKKDLPKAEVMRDFVESYKDKKGNMGMAGACRRMSSHDNDYEIGEEPEQTWGWSKSKCHGSGRGRRRVRKRTNESSGGILPWLSKRKKLDSMIECCSDILKRAGHGSSKSAENVAEDSEDGKSIIENDERISDSECVTCSLPQDKDLSSSEPKFPPDLVECPSCMTFFPGYAIELHASSCGDTAIVVD